MIPANKPIVLSLHGIRTRGEWQKLLCPYLSEKGFKYYPLDYGYFSAPSLLNPFRHSPKIRWFRDRINSVLAENPNACPSIIVHSFGSLILGKALQKYADLKFDKIVLTGSILPENYPWSEPFKRNQYNALINIIAEKDIWSKIGGTFVAGAGKSGAYGFAEDSLPSNVEQVRYSEFDHGDALYPDIFTGQILPFLQRSSVIRSPSGIPNYLIHVNPLEAACWTAVSYTRQFIARFESALQNGFFYPRKHDDPPIEHPPQKLIILIPQNAGQASSLGRTKLCNERQLRSIAFGQNMERTALMHRDGTLYDLPSALESFAVYTEFMNDRAAEEQALSHFRQILTDMIRLRGKPAIDTILIQDLEEATRKE